MAERIMLAVGDWTEDAPAQEVTAFSGIELRLSLFEAPSLGFTAPGLSPAALLLSGLASDVWVYRSGTPWQRLRVMPIGQAWGESGEDDIAVAAVGYRAVVEARYLIDDVPSFSDVEQGTIIWTLIDQTQSRSGGDLGITEGDHDTGTNRDRHEYKSGDNLGTILNALSNVIGGPWWGVDVDRVMTAKLFDAFTVRTNPIVVGMNARNAKRDPADKRYANVAGAIGSATDTVADWVEDPDVGTDPRGRWETFDATHSSVTVQDHIHEYAQGNLADRKNPPYAWTIELDPAAFFEGDSNYDVGEFVPVVVPRSAVDEIATPPITVTIQVTEIAIREEDSGELQVMLSGVEIADA